MNQKAAPAVSRTLAVVLLAAGASSRMGRPKLLLPWGATTVLGHLLAQWRELHAAQVAVVCAANDAAIPAELDRLGFPTPHRILNPAPAAGMFSSVQCAARWTSWEPGLTHWLISLGDQPHVRRETLAALLDFAAANAERVCQPGRHGRARHPVVLPAGVFAELKNSTAENLKVFLQSQPVARALYEMNDAALDFDMDEPADYERALRHYFQNDPAAPSK
jgi:molybdenum cofactor cytidylyltransferase